MDRAIAGCARTAMQGAACKKEEVGGGEMKYRSMDTMQVLQHWRLARCREEMRIRRLRWMQSWASHPGDNEQVLAVMFGKMEVEEHEIMDEKGELT
eukprot:1973102-Lingulodinium_polyedra.AAC.1